MSAPNTPEFVSVAAILPFWRYAVGPASSHSPAIPYYSLDKAEAFFEETKKALPWAGVVLYKRRWFRGITEIARYSPKSSRHMLAELAKGKEGAE